jgi:hypothetical protein
MDTSHPANPKVVHGFLPRDSGGYQIKETWDTLGMSLGEQPRRRGWG